MEDPSEFLAARHAAAAAIPPERRGADISAFLECYQLEQEVLEALLLQLLQQPPAPLKCYQGKHTQIEGNQPLPDIIP